MIKGLAHNAFKVKDMERSLHFYCDVIGLEKAFDIKDEDGNGVEFIQLNPESPLLKY